MSEPIYIMFQLRMNESWYQLSAEEQNKILDQIETINKDSGEESLILCESGWSNDEWQFFGISKHQSLKKMQENYQRLSEIHWVRHTTSKSILGTKWSRS